MNGAAILEMSVSPHRIVAETSKPALWTFLRLRRGRICKANIRAFAARFW
jgi:hypothetical protein